MKAITIKQPWAWAICHAGKTIENRDWPTNLRGMVAIHASKRMDFHACQQFAGFVEREIGTDVLHKWYDAGDPPKGAIVAVADIVDCVVESDSPWFMGKFGFVLENVRVLPEPIEYDGALGFWKVSAAAIKEIETQLGMKVREVSA